MRHLLVPIIAVLTVLAGSLAPALAQEATPPVAPGDRLAQFGYPELHITLAEDAIRAPQQVEAGRVLLVLENHREFPGGVALLQLPTGMTLDDVLAAFASPAAPPAVVAIPQLGAATPEPLAEGLPDWMYEATWAGGAFAFPGEQTQVILTLPPGEWLVLPGPESPAAAASLTVTDAAATPSTVEITADAMVEVELDSFEIRLPEQLEAGPQVWEVTNVGDQPHEIVVFQTPAPLTAEELELLLTIPEDEPPPADPPSEEELLPVAFVAPLSGGQTVWAEVDIAQGHYIAACFFPDRETGEPHAVKGMVVSFSTSAA